MPHSKSSCQKTTYRRYRKGAFFFLFPAVVVIEEHIVRANLIPLARPVVVPAVLLLLFSKLALVASKAGSDFLLFGLRHLWVSRHNRWDCSAGNVRAPARSGVHGDHRGQGHGFPATDATVAGGSGGHRSDLDHAVKSNIASDRKNCHAANEPQNDTIGGTAPSFVGSVCSVRVSGSECRGLNLQWCRLLTC